MKKTIIVIVLLFVLVSCKDKKEENRISNNDKDTIDQIVDDIGVEMDKNLQDIQQEIDINPIKYINVNNFEYPMLRYEFDYPLTCGYNFCDDDMADFYNTNKDVITNIAIEVGEIFTENDNREIAKYLQFMVVDESMIDEFNLEELGYKDYWIMSISQRFTSKGDPFYLFSIMSRKEAYEVELMCIIEPDMDLSKIEEDMKVFGLSQYQIDEGWFLVYRYDVFGLAEFEIIKQVTSDLGSLLTATKAIEKERLESVNENDLDDSIILVENELGYMIVRNLENELGPDCYEYNIVRYSSEGDLRGESIFYLPDIDITVDQRFNQYPVKIEDDWYYGSKYED